MRHSMHWLLPATSELFVVGPLSGEDTRFVGQWATVETGGPTPAARGGERGMLGPLWGAQRAVAQRAGRGTDARP